MSSGFFHSIKNTLGFQRLFWRIFLTFWIASLLVMMATGFVLVSKYTSDEYNQRFYNSVISQAERIVWRYEQDMASARSRNSELKDWIRENRNRGHAIIPMHIKDRRDNTIFHYKMNNVNSSERTAQFVSGPSNSQYRVEIKRPQAPRIYKQVLYRFQSIQFIFIFIASALVSALLSWAIVRPINYLGAFSRRYANEQDATPLPEKLLKRGDEVGDLATDIDFMVKKTHEAASAQQQLLHDVSHELRAPLARLQASAAIIEQKSPENRHVLQIHNDCARIDQLIQQILDYSKLEQSNPIAVACDLNALCERVADDMAVNYPRIPLTLAYAPNATIYGFPEALHQALDNIIGNACKYSKSGQEVAVSTLKQEDKVIITVRDHGPGVNDDEMEKLLQPFYRAGNQMHTSGFGLGLSIAKKALDKHGGSIRMRSPADGGLCVELTIPCSPTTSAFNPN